MNIRRSLTAVLALGLVAACRTEVAPPPPTNLADITLPTIETASTSTPASAPTVDCSTTGVDAQLDIAYASTPGVDPNQQSLNLYIPVRPAGCAGTPIVVYVHGGGFRGGDKANKVSNKVPLFTNEGWAFASINYRLVGDPAAGSDGAAYPRQQDDVAAAIAWLVEHAGEFGGDPSRIALMGHSAGAFLVALQSTDSSFLDTLGVDPASIRCTVPLDTETFDVLAQIDGGGNQEATYRAAFGDDPAVWEAASPLRNLDDDEPLPDFLMFTRGNDRREQGNVEFAAALTEAGSTANLVIAEPYTHEEVNEAVGQPGDTIVTPPLMDFLRPCLT
jgi:arylformamidase